VTCQADAGEVPSHRLAPRFAVMAQNHAGQTARQPGYRGSWIGEPARVGEQPKPGQAPGSTRSDGSSPCPG
jgi:hypothetical protein